MTDKTCDKNRRNFLKMAGAAAPAATVVLATAGGAEAAPQEPDPSKTKLQDTAQIRAYYDCARF